jgi:hypothetical protein
VQAKAQDFIGSDFLLGEKLKTENEEYYLLLDVGVKSNRKIASEPLSSGEVMLEKKNIFHIYKVPTSRVADNQNFFANNNYRAVWNKRTKNFGILTGTIFLELKNLSDAEELLQTYNLKETHRFQALNLVVVKIPFEDFTNTIGELKLENMLRSVEAEVLEHFQVPQ